MFWQIDPFGPPYIWPGLRQEKHTPLVMQRSCLSLNGFSKKALHGERLCRPLHDVHKLISMGALGGNSLAMVEKVVLCPCHLFLSLLSGFHLAFSAGELLSFPTLSLLSLEGRERTQSDWCRGMLHVYTRRNFQRSIRHSLLPFSLCFPSTCYCSRWANGQRAVESCNSSRVPLSTLQISWFLAKTRKSLNS